jgi:hypothetical protein
MSSYTVVTFNSKGQSVKHEQYDATDTLTGTATFTYDADGKKTRMDYAYPIGSGMEDYSYYTLYEYDANGNRTKSVTYYDAYSNFIQYLFLRERTLERMDHYYDGDLSGHLRIRLGRGSVGGQSSLHVLVPAITELACGGPRDDHHRSGPRTCPSAQPGLPWRRRLV